MGDDRIDGLIAETRPLAERFSAAGFALFLVGGIVRDLVAGRPVDSEESDLDLTTPARPAQIKSLLDGWADAIWTQGERFGTIGALIQGRRFEITTHRAEIYDPDSRKPSVEFSTDIDSDLSRRDFTVNAMALCVTSPEASLIDPFDGRRHLLEGILRTPLSPEVSFTDDPLRMLRAARFMAAYGLRPDGALLDATRRLATRLGIVSPERIRAELDKLVIAPDPSSGLWFIHDTGLAEVFFPELSLMRVEQDPIHRHKDVLAHTIAVVAKTSPDLKLRLAALFHDVGKPMTRSIDSGGVSFHHHEVVGARMTRERMRALRYSNEMVRDVSQLVYLHLRFHTYAMGWTDSAVRRFVRDAGDQLAELIELTRCDCTTRNQRKAEMLSRRMDHLEERIAALRASDELLALRPDLDGQAVMEYLGLAPGPMVGRALRHLLELKLERGPMAHSEALGALDAWWPEQQK